MRISMGWLGLGRTRDAADDAPELECGVTDSRCLADLATVLAVLRRTAPSRARSVEAMLAAPGSQVPGRMRVEARYGRLSVAARGGPVLPPWWRLRLAVRRTEAARALAAQDAPGSQRVEPAPVAPKAGAKRAGKAKRAP